jgi:hypothetical protein
MFPKTNGCYSKCKDSKQDATNTKSLGGGKCLVCKSNIVISKSHH